MASRPRTGWGISPWQNGVRSMPDGDHVLHPSEVQFEQSGENVIGFERVRPAVGGVHRPVEPLVACASHDGRWL